MRPALRRLALSLAAAALLVATPTFADGTAFTLLAGVTTPGPSSSVHASVSPAETGRETWSFLFASSGSGSAAVELSLDSGATFQAIYSFKGNADLFQIPACGACYLRARAIHASAGNTVTVGASVSGAVVPAVVAP